MAVTKHLEILSQGVEAWNQWRSEHPRIRPDLSVEPTTQLDADVQTVTEAVITAVMPGRVPASGLYGKNLAEIDFHRANLMRADLSRTFLVAADLSHADLRGANLAGCVLTSANLAGANLAGANLNGATLRWATLSRANLQEATLQLANLDGVEATHADFQQADLFYASLVQAKLVGADLTGSLVYGVSAWDVDLQDAKQKDLVITRAGGTRVTTDDLQIAQFLYLLLNNRNIRTVIDTLTTKIVLILGRFTAERKRVLDGLRDELHRRAYVPIMFDFERPASRDFTETIVTLAHMARFIVADITDPGSIPKELEAIVPSLAVPVQPLLQKNARMYAMFSDYWKYDWVLKIYRYGDLPDLIASLNERVIAPAERKARQLARKRALSIEDA